MTLVTVGAVKESWLERGCQQYAQRLDAHGKFQLVEIAPSHERDPQRQVADESVRLLIAADRFPGQHWILDEQGVRVTSEAFATLVGKARDRGGPLTFVLGGAHGVSDDVKKSGQLLRLSDMTLPHDLCRLLFLEQLYRACEIVKGTGYHHGIRGKG